MRDNQDNEVDLSSLILWPHNENVDPNLSPIHSAMMDTIKKETRTPLSMHASAPVHSNQPLQDDAPSSPPTDAQLVSDSLVNKSPTGLELRPSPSPSPKKPQPQPRQRKRKRKQFFDESLVLT